jgi:hypothetical protein
VILIVFGSNGASAMAATAAFTMPEEEDGKRKKKMSLRKTKWTDEKAV